MGRLETILEFKFCQNTVLYTCKQDKIDYIKDYYKNITFKVIKTKTNAISANTYFSISKII